MIGSGGEARGLPAELEDLDVEPPGPTPDGSSRRGRRTMGVLGTVALLVLAATGLVHARSQQARDVASQRVAVTVQAARPVGELRTFTDPTGPHAFMTVAVAVLSQGPSPLRVVDARLVGPHAEVPLRYPTTLPPGQVLDLEAANLDPCPAPLGLTSVRLTVRNGAARPGTLTLPVPGGLDGLSENCPQPGLLPLRGALALARATGDGHVVAEVEVTSSSPRPVRVDGVDLQAGSATVGARVAPATPFDVPAATVGAPATVTVTVTVPPPPCARGMFSTWNDVSDPASLTLAYSGAAQPAADGVEPPTVTLVVDLGEQWKAARRTAMSRVCGG